MSTETKDMFAVTAVHNGTLKRRRKQWIVNALDREHAIQKMRSVHGEFWPPGTYWSAEMLDVATSPENLDNTEV